MVKIFRNVLTLSEAIKIPSLLETQKTRDQDDPHDLWVSGNAEGNAMK